MKLKVVSIFLVVHNSAYMYSILSAYFKVEQPNNSGIDDILVPIVKHSCTYSSELVNL